MKYDWCKVWPRSKTALSHRSSLLCFSFSEVTNWSMYVFNVNVQITRMGIHVQYVSYVHRKSILQAAIDTE